MAYWIAFLLTCPLHVAAQKVYEQPVFNVFKTNETYAEGLTCSSDYTACKPMALQLDMYQPVSRAGGPSVPSLKPAYILAHGGGNKHGSKKGMQGAAAFYAGRGFVSFSIDYRLQGAYGLAPPSQPNVSRPDLWKKNYPAVRDAKAAIRFVRANAKRFGVDPDRIAVSGGSAGACDMLAAGATFEGDFKDEISVEQDPTLLTTNLNFSSKPQCMVLHWSAPEDVQLVQLNDPLNRTRWSKDNAPIVEFHGNKDTTIPIEYAYETQAAYKKSGVDYELHVLDGCPHASWCYDGKGQCRCTKGDKRPSTMDTIALPFVAKHLHLEVVRNSSISV